MWIWKSDLQYWIRELEHKVEKHERDSKENIYFRGKLMALLKLQQKKSPI